MVGGERRDSCPKWFPVFLTGLSMASVALAHVLT